MGKRAVLRLGLVVVSAITGFWVFPDISLDVQLALTKHVTGTAGSLFAILGVWIAILDPRRLLDETQGSGAMRNAQSLELLQDLMAPWLQVTAVFAWLIAHFLFLTIAGTFPNATEDTTFLAISGAVIVLTTLLVLDGLLGTLLPVAFLRQSTREAQLRQQSRTGI